MALFLKRPYRSPRLSQHLWAYMAKNAPKKYHAFLRPTYPMGCKRIIMDPGYLRVSSSLLLFIRKYDVDTHLLAGPPPKQLGPRNGRH